MLARTDIDIPEAIVAQIAADCRVSFSGIYPTGYDFVNMAREFVDPVRIREQISLLKKMTGTSMRGNSLLEIGSGYGMLPALVRIEEGCNSWGIEPSDQFSGTYQICRKIFHHNRIPEHSVVQGFGEHLPFKSGMFDIVCSTNVLEHVANPFGVLCEAVRVLKPGGRLLFSMPNYGSWWEGHYGFLTLPIASRRLLKWQAIGCRRNPDFIDTLQLITFTKLVHWVKAMPVPVVVEDYGQQLWEDRVRTMEFSEWADLATLKRVVRCLRRVGLINLVVWAGKKMHWETPLVLSLTKTICSAADGAGS